MTDNAELSRLRSVSCMRVSAVTGIAGSAFGDERLSASRFNVASLAFHTLMRSVKFTARNVLRIGETCADVAVHADLNSVCFLPYFSMSRFPAVLYAAEWQLHEPNFAFNSSLVSNET